jgi:hypothetical protein
MTLSQRHEPGKIEMMSSVPLSEQNSANWTAGHNCEHHADDHEDGPDCGHEAVGHDDHVDYVVGVHLHHPNGDHGEHHGE